MLAMYFARARKASSLLKSKKVLVEKRIYDFIAEHHILTLATAFDNEPWTANCFYAWLKDEQAFVFTSDSDTKHIRDLVQGEKVAGSVVLETKIVGKIRGIQFTGRLYEPRDELLKKCKTAYLKRFPYAVLMKTQLWILEVDYIKMTDNRLGFGKKLKWERGNQEGL
jgi:uncharacterized protein YhbP (UPF0306 family)